MAKPHDALFRLTFENPAHAADELRTVLPARAVRVLDLATLERMPGSFVGDDLRDQHSDVLYRVRLRNGRRALVFVLFEHQSSSDRWMALRLLGYMLRIWEAYLRRNPRARWLPPIVPVVVAHGPGGWRARTQFADLVDLRGVAATLTPHVPAFSYLVDDLASVPDADLASRPVAAALRVVLLALKNWRARVVRGVEHVRALVDEVLAAPGGRALLEALAQYTIEVRRNEQDGLQLAAGLGEEVKKMATSAAEKIERRGYKKGLAEGSRGGAEALRKLLARQLTQRFGPLPAPATERLARADAGDLARWGERVLAAPSLEAVFAD